MSEIPKPSIQEVPDKDADIFADMDALAGEIIASAQPKSSKSGKPRTGGNGSKSELNPGELVRFRKNGSEYISNTEGRIALAQTVEELMELADRISSKKGSQKEKFSLKLANGLPGLLPLDEDFSKKFNGLIDRWEKRIVEVFFDDAHTKHFRSSLRDVLKITPDVDKGMFFSRYLDYFDCSALGDVIPVREKLVALWEEQFPAVMRELKDQKKQQAKFVVGDTYTLRSDSSKEYVITEVSDEKIAYKSVDSGLVSYSTKEKFARFLKKKSSRKTRGSNVSTTTFSGNPGKQEPIPDEVSPEPISSEELERGRQVEIELRREVELGISIIQAISTKEEWKTVMVREGSKRGHDRGMPRFATGKFFADLLKKQSITSDQEKRRLKSLAYKLQEQISPIYLAKQAEIYPSKVADVAKDNSVASVTPSGPAPDAATSNPDIPSEPSMRPYDELMGKLGERKRDVDLELTRLKSAVAAGLQEIMKLIPDRDESDAYIREERTQLIADFSAQIIIRLEKLPWTPEERKFFAETFVEKEIDGFLE